MPHKIRVCVIGEGEYLPRLIRAILEQQIVPEANVFLSANSEASKEAAKGTGAVFCPDDANTVVKSEVVIVCASAREFGTVLAPISQTTQGRILIGLCPSAKVDADYIVERVSGGTEIVAAPFDVAADGSCTAHVAWSHGFPLFMEKPCLDLIGALCDHIEQ